MIVQISQQTLVDPGRSGDRSTAQTNDPSGPVRISANRTLLSDTAEQSEPKSPARTYRDSVQVSEEALEISKLAERDREVRAHEAAHAAAGGRYAGSPSLTYTQGPDGRSYATGGEVPIDVSPISGDPQATLQKAQVVRSAALAPAHPSAQDMQIAARASAMAAKASNELADRAKDAGTMVDADPRGSFPQRNNDDHGTRLAPMSEPSVQTQSRVRVIA